MIHQKIKNSIEEASKVIGNTWPLYSFVTSNPLSGYEKQHFQDALVHAEKYIGTEMFPNKELFKNAWDNGSIDRNVIAALLKEHNLLEKPEYYLEQLPNHSNHFLLNEQNDLDRMMSKWLSTFMDEGIAEWTMPNKNEGFYKAWRSLAKYDNELPKTTLQEIPLTSKDALETLLNGYSDDQMLEIFKYHLAALPGWTGYINHRNQYNSSWQQEYPISLEDYLAVRIWIAKKLNIDLMPNNFANSNSKHQELQYIWLKAWEKSWQLELENLLNKENLNSSANSNDKLLDAQMVFCIDTRSELIRRHIENKGNYETFGYAGFFGIAMDYESMNDGIIKKSCPPILTSAYQVSETPQDEKLKEAKTYKRNIEIDNFKEYFLKRIKNMLPSAFGFVEGSGFFYGLSLVARTLIPAGLFKFNNKIKEEKEQIFTPEIKKSCNHDKAELDIPLEEKVAIVKSGFDLMGWKKFAPVVLFVGHGSHSANNPFGSSLDCGACAASPGRHNARMLAKFANLKAVQKQLKENHNIEIPATTIFVGAEHNTTTDEIILFDSEVSSFHEKDIEKLKTSLREAQKTATQERLGISNNSVHLAYKKANNWGETRPEWGLAKNASFIVGPRSLTKSSNLDGRCFLHSYDWKADKEGKALQAIMQGPMVVTQWINNHYYFSTVSNNTFGSGSKITHNVTGKFGVVQGNGGDLKMGLPLQSLMETDSQMYHQPLRLSVVIQAPINRVTEILLSNDNLKQLLDNEWIHLLVMDPIDDNNMYYYEKNLNWLSNSETDIDKSLDELMQVSLKGELV